MPDLPLAGRTIAVPETRELDVFATLLERRGATVLRCPLVAIVDAPDAEPVLGWIRRFNSGAIDDLILLTGEGLRRLLGCIDRNDPALRDEFVARLAAVRKITRGPKPARALRELGLQPDIAADVPTTEGVIASLDRETLAGRRIAVQLYGEEPNDRLIRYLESRGATVATVAPYRYADEADDERVRELLKRMADGKVDAIAFTSTPQVTRLFAVGPETLAAAALAKTTVAAVGPVVADALAQRGIAATLMPADSFFLKPLTTLLADALGPPSSVPPSKNDL